MPKKTRKLPNLIWLLVALVTIIILGTVGYALNRTHKKVSTIPSSSPSKTVSSTPSTPTSNNSNDSSLTDSSKSAPSPSTGSSSLISPYGSFISNHHPTISLGNNKPGPNETSVCNTTPGANCSISFTKGNTVKQLSSQVTDSGGAAYWNWNINDAGLSTGSWQVTVTASLNGKTLIANDTLEVQP